MRIKTQGFLILNENLASAITDSLTEEFSSNYDVWPVDITNLGRMFQTMKENPDFIKLNPEGKIPDWLEGSLLRNGPGKYEFGNDTFKHFFDPSAIIQGKVIFRIESEKTSLLSNMALKLI